MAPAMWLPSSMISTALSAALALAAASRRNRRWTGSSALPTRGCSRPLLVSAAHCGVCTPGRPKGVSDCAHFAPGGWMQSHALVASRMSKVTSTPSGSYICCAMAICTAEPPQKVPSSMMRPGLTRKRSSWIVCESVTLWLDCTPNIETPACCTCSPPPLSSTRGPIPTSPCASSYAQARLRIEMVPVASDRLYRISRLG
mmetsp:Transcript_17878/g.42400  ORF Transcript_17878/g.42400 Transcript_17878/m.42400 type:complete len:200 (+) Transcript_17878:480-1079(+)